MQDRASTKPNRYAVYDDNHNFLRYEYHERADEPTQAGTPINKATMLKDSTCALYGLPFTAVPDDVFVANESFVNNKVKSLDKKLYLHRVSSFQKMMTGGFR